MMTDEQVKALGDSALEQLADAVMAATVKLVAPAIEPAAPVRRTRLFERNRT
jgi:hypothetical protein